MKLLLILILFAGVVHAGELEETIALLGNDEFEIRERASEKLSHYPKEYVKKFLDMAEKEGDPEIRYRLFSAAQAVHTRAISMKSDQWLYLHGALGLEITRQNVCKYEVDPNTGSRNWVTYETVCFVDFMKEDIVGDKIKQLDRIMSISNNTNLDNIQIKPDTEYKVVLRRYKNIEQIQNQQFDFEDKEYEEIEVTIKAGEKEERFVDCNEKLKIIESQWKQYFEEYKNAELSKTKNN